MAWPAWGRIAVVVLLLTAALALGLYLRLVAVYNVPFYEDDYASALQVTGIMRTGKPTFPSGWVQWAEPVALPYLVSILWRFTGPDIMVGRLLSAVLGTLSIGVAYLLGRRVHSRVTGAVFALFVALNLWSVASSAYFRHYALAELAFLLLCDFAVRWLKSRRTLKGYLAVLSGSAVVAVIGHFILLPILPVVALLPAIAKVCDALGRRVRLVPAAVGVPGRRGVRVHVQPDVVLVLLLAGLSAAVGAFFWALPRYGLLIPRTIGAVTGEFFTVLPEGARVSFQPFFVQSLLTFYGPWILGLIGVGALIMLIQTGRSGLTILLYFGLPFVLLSTIFASLTVTSMFDRYLFPYNPALLLMLSSFVAWASERPVRWVVRAARTGREHADLITPAVAGVLAVTLLTQGGSWGALPPATLPAAVDTWIRSRTEPHTPTYRRATAYLKTHLAPGDVVLGTRPVDLAVEIPRTPGYWLMSDPQELSEVGVRKNGQLVNRYTGYPVIADLEQLLNLMARSPRLWVVVPHFHDSPGTLSPGMWGVLHSWMGRVAEASDETLALYRSRRQHTALISLSPAVRGYGNTSAVVPVGDHVTLFRGRPGPVNWAGVEYRLPTGIAASQSILEVSIRVDEIRGADGPVSVDVILEEVDGDRWHAPGRLQVQPGDRWQRFFLPFSYLRFWPLGEGTPQPNTVRTLKLEVHNARTLTFRAHAQARLIRPVAPTAGGSP